jgi:DNA-binding winged helix-turn-helix (wHTH) protein
MGRTAMLHLSRSGVALKTSSPTAPPFRFGVFELDPQAGELRKNGMKVRLQGQPVEILVILLERPGETVTREELQEKLWPADTFVDFEQGLNNAMNRLRAALDDNAQVPRYVETVPRRGYRFIASVSFRSDRIAELLQSNEARVNEQGVQPRHSKPMSFEKAKERRWLWFAGIVAVLIMAVVLRRLGERDPGQQIESRRQITASSTDDPVFRAALSADGKYLAYTDSHGVHLQQLNTGETHALPVPKGLCFR